MHLRDLIHGLHLAKLRPKKELTEIYISISLKYLAVSMINLFLPIYIYHRLGYTLNETLIFFIIYAVAFALFTPLAAKLISRIGVKHTILAAMPLYLVFYLFLYGLDKYPIPLYVVPLFFSAAQAFFWLGFHTEFVKSSDHNHRGREVSKYISFAYLAILVGPLVGGFLIDSFGFAPLFLLVGVLLFVSAAFLFFTKDFREPNDINFKHIFSKENMDDALSYFAYGCQQMAEGVLWPLFIFVILKTYTNLGLLGSSMAAVIALMTYLVGRISDKYNARNILYIGGIVYSLSWAVRTLFNTVGYVFGITMFASVAHTFLHTPLEALTYDKAEKKVLEKLVFREIAMNIGRVCVLLVVLLTGNFVGGFVFSAFAGIGYLFF